MRYVIEEDDGDGSDETRFMADKGKVVQLGTNISAKWKSERSYSEESASKQNEIRSLGVHVRCSFIPRYLKHHRIFLPVEYTDGITLRFRRSATSQIL